MAGRHRDVSLAMHHDDAMRTTLTLDNDGATLPREEAEQHGLPLKEVVNRAILLDLHAGSAPRSSRSFACGRTTLVFAPALTRISSIRSRTI